MEPPNLKMNAQKNLFFFFLNPPFLQILFLEEPETGMIEQTPTAGSMAQLRTQLREKKKLGLNVRLVFRFRLYSTFLFSFFHLFLLVGG